MPLPKFDFIAAKSMEEAANLVLELGDKCKVMAGGTDVLLLLRDHVITPETVISLREIPNLDFVNYIPGEGARIGALATLNAIETSEAIKKEMPAVSDSAHYVASKQVRCKGTMVGNICNASPSADTSCILIVMNAKVKTVRATGAGREIPVGEFFTGVKRTALEQGELVTEVDIPELKSGEGSAYYKHAIRKAMDLAIIGVGVWVKMDGKKVADCRIAFGGAGVTALRAYEAEKILIGNEYSEELLEKAALAASEASKPISDVRASVEYRKDMIRVFTKRSFKKALENLKA